MNDFPYSNRCKVIVAAMIQLIKLQCCGFSIKVWDFFSVGVGWGEKVGGVVEKNINPSATTLYNTITIEPL